jgi:hypothetical protein
MLNCTLEKHLGGGMLYLVVNNLIGEKNCMDYESGKIFGEAIKKKRDELGMTQIELSILARINNSKLSGLERYGKPVLFDEGMRLICILKIPLEDISRAVGVEADKMIELMEMVLKLDSESKSKNA